MALHKWGNGVALMVEQELTILEASALTDRRAAGARAFWDSKGLLGLAWIRSFLQS